MTRELYPMTGFRTHQPLHLPFRLGDVDRVEELVVRWPSGTVQRLSAPPLDRIPTVTEEGR